MVATQFKCTYNLDTGSTAALSSLPTAAPSLGPIAAPSSSPTTASSSGPTPAPPAVAVHHQLVLQHFHR